MRTKLSNEDFASNLKGVSSVKYAEQGAKRPMMAVIRQAPQSVLAAN